MPAALRAGFHVNPNKAMRQAAQLGTRALQGVRRTVTGNRRNGRTARNDTKFKATVEGTNPNRGTLMPL
jgi:hypothetical protein